MNKRVIELGIILFSTMILLPALLGDRQKDDWAKWVFDYQTLIAGTLAVVAAVLTIRQMQTTDAKQARHHRELIELQLFQQQVTIQQASELIRALIISTTPNLVLLKNTIERHGNGADEIFPNAEEYADAISNIERFFYSPAMARVEPLLGGDIILKILRARKSADRLAEFAQICTFADPDDASDPELHNFVDFLTVRYGDIFKQATCVLSVIDELSKEFKILKVRFGVPKLPS